VFSAIAHLMKGDAAPVHAIDKPVTVAPDERGRGADPTHSCDAAPCAACSPSSTKGAWAGAPSGARLAGDEAHLVAKRRTAGEGRVRGYRPGPARFGDSGIAPDGFEDVPSHSRDLATLRDALGIARCVPVGGDLGGAIIQDFSRRFPERVSRLVIFNSPLPYLKERMSGLRTRAPVQAADYFLRAGHAPTRSRASSIRPRSAAATSRPSTARASGRIPARSRARRSTS
jgi:pimeloyl-ACP methyl ester carboxylesterase